MLGLDNIRAKLTDRRLDVVSGITGIHRNTLGGIRTGRIKNPSYETVRRLSEYFTTYDDDAGQGAGDTNAS